MATYLKYQEINASGKSDAEYSDLYAQGFLFGRRFKGDMYQSRSVRIDLSKFSPNSENRRVIGKFPDLEVSQAELPYAKYSWQIHKLGKDFYDKRFGPGIMTASKIKEMLTNPLASNVNSLLVYNLNGETIGYALCYSNTDIIHYAYPFYNLELQNSNLGMAMMLKAILLAKDDRKKYIYLGTAADSSSKYKLQFSGLEWWNNSEWSSDITQLKADLKDSLAPTAALG